MTNKKVICVLLTVAITLMSVLTVFAEDIRVVYRDNNFFDSGSTELRVDVSADMLESVIVTVPSLLVFDKNTSKETPNSDYNNVRVINSNIQVRGLIADNMKLYVMTPYKIELKNSTQTAKIDVEVDGVGNPYSGTGKVNTGIGKFACFYDTNGNLLDSLYYEIPKITLQNRTTQNITFKTDYDKLLTTGTYSTIVTFYCVIDESLQNVKNRYFS